MNERIVSFGQFEHLSGLVTYADSLESDTSVVILNAGLAHRVGPCRVAVNLARALAGDGYTVLRFDFAGIGYSNQRTNKLAVDEPNVSEIIEALDFLSSQYGINRFILYGLCSGARDAFQAALRDDRIIGLAQIDGYAYRNYKYYTHHYLPRLLKPSSWVRFFMRTLAGANRWFYRNQITADENRYVFIWAPYPSRAEIEAGYASLVNRGVHFFVLFTGSWQDQYNYDEQFFDMYPSVSFKNQLLLIFKPETNHLMTNPEHQDWLRNNVACWVKSSQDWTR